MKCWGKAMISIIVPVYKVMPYLRQCVDSILNQSYHNVEILLIDDGSPDGCGGICDEYLKKDERIRVFHTENRGLSAARNLGLREAKGEYIGFVDSDDWIEPSMFEVLLKILEETHADIRVCDFVREPDSFAKAFQPIKAVYQGADILNALLEKQINYTVWNKLFRRELFDGLRFPDGKNYEDIALMHRIMYAANRVVVIPVTGYHYRVRPDSITRNFTAKNLIDYADAYLDSYSFLCSCRLESFTGKRPEILRLPAKGIAIVWRWWYGCNEEDKEIYQNRIKDMLIFTQKHFPMFGYRSWPGYLRFSAAFMHSDSRVTFAVLYSLNQLFRNGCLTPLNLKVQKRLRSRDRKKPARSLRN